MNHTDIEQRDGDVHLPSEENQAISNHDALPVAHLADLTPRMQAAVARAGWSDLMPVQAKAMPYLFAQKDMMIQSRTGSGKTGAYLLPLLEMLNPLDRTTQAMVLVPTRELAHQVETEAKILGEETGLSCIAVYGGVGYREQLDAFRSGVHLVVGTPGRILDHLLRRSLSLEHLKYLVFDEADRMLSMGFYPDMRRVQGYLPEHHISTFMFSATFPPQVIRLANQFLHEPGFLNLSSDHIHVTETEHVYYEVPGMDKDRSLVRILEVENPPSALIFCNTKVRVNYVTTVLKRFGFDADELTSDLSQGNRERVLEQVRQGKLRFLVATDVAARGIDLPDLSHVIQYEPPEDPEAYIHRAGRTGRAGASGTAVSLVNITEKAALLRIGKQFGINLQPVPLPTDADVEKVVAERAITLLETHLHNRDRLENERMQRFASLAHSLTQDDDENQLLAMLLDEFYQRLFHLNPISTDDVEQNTPQNPRASTRRGGHRNRRPRDHR